MPSWAVSRESLQALFATLKTFRTAWPSRGWSWDSRHLCVSSSFHVEHEARARQTAAASFPLEWSAATIARAPQNLRELAERSGGVRAGQLVLATGSSGAVSFGLWWPWGDGEMISLRVGLADFADPNAEPYTKLREIFSVTV